MNSFKSLIEKRKAAGRLDISRQFLKWFSDAQEIEGRGITLSSEMQDKDIEDIVDKKHQILSEIQPQNVPSEEIEQDEEYSPEEKEAIIRELTREYKQATAVSSELESEIESLETDLDSRWQKADSFKELEEDFQKLVELKREYAEQRGYEEEPYEVFFSQYEPYLELDDAESLLHGINEGLDRVLEEIDLDEWSGEFEPILPESKRHSREHLEFQRYLLTDIGLDPETTPLANASHGLEAGHRLSTPTLIDIDKSLPAAVKTNLHESGHQKYRKNLGKSDDTKYLFTPLGEPASHLVDESQARFWENHVARSREFAEYIAPEIKDQFEVDLETDEIADSYYNWMNEVDPDTHNRLESDELSYHKHILLRFEIERDLINGEIEAEEVPELWEEKSEEYLGSAPDKVYGGEDGVLQDPHWFRGKFGYFPQYTLGTALSAQLAYSMEEENGPLDQKIQNGEYSEITEWLADNIHQYGKQYPTDELIERATGEKLSPEPLVGYLEEKFVE